MSYHHGIGAEMTTEEAIETVQSVTAPKVGKPGVPTWFIAAAVLLIGGAVFLGTRKHPRGDTI